MSFACISYSMMILLVYAQNLSNLSSSDSDSPLHLVEAPNEKYYISKVEIFTNYWSDDFFVHC